MSTIRRLNNIFAADGRAVIVALDHGLIDGPCEGFEDPARTINQVVEGGADAILTSYGIANRFAAELSRVGLIIRGDGAATNLGTPSDGSASSLFFTVEEALRVGADALVVTAMPGCEKEESTLANLSRMTREAHKWGMPVLGEMVPGGFDGTPETRGTEAVSIAARLGAELGADFIKAPYTENFGEVTSKTFAPVVILGGSKGDERAMLSNISEAVAAGAVGVAIGRNVFQCDDPTAMTAAIAAVVHEGATVDAAYTIASGA